MLALARTLSWAAAGLGVGILGAVGYALARSKAAGLW